MMIPLPVLFEVSLVIPGCDNRSIGYPYNTQNALGRRLRVLYPDIPRLAVVPCPYGEHVAAEVYYGMLYSFPDQRLLDLVGCIALGDAAEVKAHAVPFQVYFPFFFVYLNVPVVCKLQRIFQLLLPRYFRVFGSYTP